MQDNALDPGFGALYNKEMFSMRVFDTGLETVADPSVIYAYVGNTWVGRDPDPAGARVAFHGWFCT